MNENKKGSVGKVIIVILLLMLFSVGGIIAGSYLTSHNMLNFIKTAKKIENNDKEKESEKELDLNSRLVKFLYNEVTEDELTPNWKAGWRYAESGPESAFNDYKYNKIYLIPF